MGAKNEITAIILTGGRSTRMGRDKGMMEFEGVRLIDHAINIVSELCTDIIISANHNSYHQTGLRIIKDIIPGIGPMGGLHACLSQSVNNLHIVLAVDMPLIKPDLFHHLLTFAEGRDAVVPLSGRKLIEPLAAVYNKSILEEMGKMIANGDFKLAGLLKAVNTHYAKMDKSLHFYSPAIFHNINWPGDATI